VFNQTQTKSNLSKMILRLSGTPFSTMKTIVTFILALFSVVVVSAQGMTLEEARKVYSESMKDNATCEAAYTKISQVANYDNSILTGYKAAITIAMSKYLKTTKEKIAYFNRGKLLLESAITKDDKNVELKFIRYTIQSNCPPALKYTKNKATDKTYIIENLASVKNNSIRTSIKDYLLQSKDTSPEEKQKLNGL
jgi:hypothetical protein